MTKKERLKGCITIKNWINERGQFQTDINIDEPPTDWRVMMACMAKTMVELFDLMGKKKWAR